MWIYRILNILNEKQKEIISIEKKKILNNCSVIASAENLEQGEAKKSHDDVCPNCHARKDNIVNKIRDVIGKGDVSGSFHFGYGSVSGTMTINTFEVNHCNVCGNEWKKYNVRYVSNIEILKVALKYLIDILNDPKQKEYSWKLQTIKVFDNCNVETIMLLCKEYKLFLKNYKFKYSKLKKHYKSIYSK